MPTAVASAYAESSQYKRWTFTPSQLKDRREQTNITAVTLVKANVQEESELTSQKQETAIDYPDATEELLIVNYYASKAFDTGAVFNLPSHLKATAASYVKRFFLEKSSLQYHPKNIMITSLFLATKTCEHHVDLDVFTSKLPKQTRETVLENEFLISSVIQFDFVHWSAYRPLYGFTLDMESTLSSAEDGGVPVSSTTISKLHESAKALINSCAWSDLPFIYTPSHLALAALHVADNDCLALYLARKGLSDLVPQLQEIAKELEETASQKFDSSEMMAKVKAADRKLYYAKDPAMKKTSALYKRRQEEEENEEEAKRKRKGEANREATESFGNVLS